jgi:hypothetical protein
VSRDRNGFSEPSVDELDQELLEPDEVLPEERLEPRIDREPEPPGEIEIQRAAETAEAPPAEPPAEDFLEETPDFLEETPEHDRLWFEQREPKDFNFD